MCILEVWTYRECLCTYSSFVHHNCSLGDEKLRETESVDEFHLLSTPCKHIIRVEKSFLEPVCDDCIAEEMNPTMRSRTSGSTIATSIDPSKQTDIGSEDVEKDGRESLDGPVSNNTARQRYHISSPKPAVHTAQFSKVRDGDQHSQSRDVEADTSTEEPIAYSRRTSPCLFTRHTYSSCQCSNLVLSKCYCPELRRLLANPTKKGVPRDSDISQKSLTVLSRRKSLSSLHDKTMQILEHIQEVLPRPATAQVVSAPRQSWHDGTRTTDEQSSWDLQHEVSQDQQTTIRCKNVNIHIFKEEIDPEPFCSNCKPKESNLVKSESSKQESKLSSEGRRSQETNCFSSSPSPPAWVGIVPIPFEDQPTLPKNTHSLRRRLSQLTLLSNKPSFPRALPPPPPPPMNKLLEHSITSSNCGTEAEDNKQLITENAHGFVPVSDSSLQPTLAGPPLSSTSLRQTVVRKIRRIGSIASSRSAMLSRPVSRGFTR